MIIAERCLSHWLEATEDGEKSCLPLAVQYRGYSEQYCLGQQFSSKAQQMYFLQTTRMKPVRRVFGGSPVSTVTNTATWVEGVAGPRLAELYIPKTKTKSHWNLCLTSPSQQLLP